MASKEMFRILSHEETDLDMHAYMDKRFTHFDSSRQNEEFWIFVRVAMIKSLYEIYNTGNVTGDRLLEIGCGPVCYGAFPARHLFNEIYLSDKSEEIVHFLQKWKDGENVQQQQIIQYMADLEGLQQDWQAADRELAQKVCSIVKIDVNQERPLSETEIGHVQFDLICLLNSSLPASITEEKYRKAVINYSGLLKTGGHVIVTDVLEASSYTVGHLAYKLLKATKHMIQSIFIQCGYDILIWKEETYTGPGESPPFFLMMARKK